MEKIQNQILEKDRERMKELVGILNKASKAYYQDGIEIMSNFEYDAMYDELLKLEESCGMQLSNSPTLKVGYEVLSELQKEAHAEPMLSLDKTKEIPVLAEFLQDKEGILSWKLDGLTIVLTYENGELQKAVTRGNGEIGEVVTGNAKVFQNIPMKIPYAGHLVLRGEAVIKYSDFERMNEQIEDADAKYKNPRNLCSGSVRQLNNEVTASRNVYFYAFALIEAEGVEFHNSLGNQLDWLSSQGFDVVEYVRTDASKIEESVRYYSEKIKDYDIPSDGLVLILDDIIYGKSLGRTAKFPRNGLAFKWRDEIAVTHLVEIDWSPSRTGLINPVAVFEPVELEGTTVTRASIHNISVAEHLELGIGDEITVYKANMIIPQIADNHTRSGLTTVPEICPACGLETTIREDNGFKFLYCENKSCPAKQVKRFSHFVSRNAMNIDGLSEETVEKFLDWGYFQELSDIYKLQEHEEDIVGKKGFGKKSYDNFIASIEKSRNTTGYRLIHGLGILNIGLTNAKMLCREFDDDIERLVHATKEELMAIDGIGEVIAQSFVDYFADEKNFREYENLLKELRIEKRAYPKEQGQESKVSGKTFVITGSLETFANRDACKEKIESLGGKVTGSVTKKTDYLVNNDATSSSTKNKKAKELGVAIITEAQLLALFE